MSEEEKEAIEDIDLFIHCLNYGEMKMTIASERQKEIAQELQMLLNLLNKEQKEIEEKTTIIMAGAEKVKQLEKEIQRLEKDNDTLSELVIVNEDKVIKELDLISKDKIREKIKEIHNEGTFDAEIVLTKLLEEK